MLVVVGLQGDGGRAAEPSKESKMYLVHCYFSIPRGSVVTKPMMSSSGDLSLVYSTWFVPTA